MNPLRILFLILLTASGLALSGCVWGEQDADETADNVIKGLSGQGTLTGENASDPASWVHRN